MEVKRWNINWPMFDWNLLIYFFLLRSVPFHNHTNFTFNPLCRRYFCSSSCRWSHCWSAEFNFISSKCLNSFSGNVNNGDNQNERMNDHSTHANTHVQDCTIFQKHQAHQHNHKVTMHQREMRNRNVDVIILKSSKQWCVFLCLQLWHACVFVGWALCCAFNLANNFMRWVLFFAFLLVLGVCVCLSLFSCSPNIYCLKQSEKNSFWIVHCLCVLFVWMNAPKKYLCLWTCGFCF